MAWNCASSVNRETKITVQLHPEVALYLMEQEPGLLEELRRATGMELELRDNPTTQMDQFRLVAQPAGRDVTGEYEVA